MRYTKYVKLFLLLVAIVWSNAAMAVQARTLSERELRAMGIKFLTLDGAELGCNADGTTDSAGDTAANASIPPGAKLFFLGDSLTFGMVNLGGLLEKAAEKGFTTDAKPNKYGSTTPIGTYKVGGVYGNSVSATGGITIGDSARIAVDYSSNEIAQAGTIIIGLGTNGKQEAKADIESAKTKSATTVTDEEVAQAQAKEIPALIQKIRAVNTSNVPIFWVNVNTTNPAYANSATVNKTIADGKSAGYTVIDTASAPASEGGDGVHYSPTGYKQRAQWLVDQLAGLRAAASAPGTPTGTITTSANSGNTFDPTSLTFPAFPDKAAIASKTTAYIRQQAPTSPWLTAVPDIGTWIVENAESRNINPLIFIGIGKQENQYGTIGANPKVNNNYFGIKGPRGYVHYETPEKGLTAFMDILKRNIIDKTHPSYKDVTNAYEYISVHQTGGIHYPGDDLSVNDGEMGVTVKWDGPYNPRVYWATMANVMTEITGVQISQEIPARGTTLAISRCASSIPDNAAAAGQGSNAYVADCTANDGNAAIACTAINQLQGIKYAELGTNRDAPDDPNPDLLDCSALVAMAIYRTFGVNLGGICSVGFKTDPHFQVIPLSEILPGDMVGWGTSCGTKAHISIVASYNKVSDDLVVMQASSPTTPSGVKQRKLNSSDYTWAVRYIGQKTLQEGAL